MLDGFPLIGVPGIVGILFILFFPYLQMARGKLVPRSTLEDVIRDRDQWRAAHEVSEKARELDAETSANASAQVGDLLELARTTDAFIRAAVNRPDRAD
jgi:hypothetical protein